MSTPTRIWVVIGFAVVLAFWTYAEQRDDLFYGSDLAAYGFLLVALLAGFVVRRWWVLAALAGPLLVLAVLEVSGFVGPNSEWGEQPLLSPPGLFQLGFLAIVMWIGVSIRGMLQRLLDGARGR